MSGRENGTYKTSRDCVSAFTEQKCLWIKPDNLSLISETHGKGKMKESTP